MDNEIFEKIVYGKLIGVWLQVVHVQRCPQQMTP